MVEQRCNEWVELHQLYKDFEIFINYKKIFLLFLQLHSRKTTLWDQMLDFVKKWNLLRF